MYTPFDELLEGVGRVADAPSLESIRKSVTRDLVQVYRKMGTTRAWQPDALVYELDDSSYLTLPEYTIQLEGIIPGSHDSLRILDILRGLPQISTLGDVIHQMPDVSRYQQSGNRIYFEQPVTGSITVLYWRIPLDERGVPLVDDRLFTAAKLYCQAEQARIALHRKNKQSYSGVPYQINRQEAASEMDAARASFNQLSKTDWLQLYADLVRQQ